jgi:uncharacterized protein YraI
MKHLKVLGFLAAALATLPVVSHAQQWAYTAKDVNLRAGPARDYPVVARVRAGVAIDVQGCLSDYRWCDVVAGPSRGWLYAGNMVYPYEGSQVPVQDYGAALGIGIVAFTLGSYWDNHYRASPWYPQRHLWMGRPDAGFRPEGYRPSPRPGFVPGHRPLPAPGWEHGGHRPQQGQGLPPGGYRPPQGMGPGTGTRPPQGGAAPGGHQPPQGGAAPGGHRPPQGGGLSGGSRPPQGPAPGTGGRRSQDDGQGPAGALRP